MNQTKEVVASTVGKSVKYTLTVIKWSLVVGLLSASNDDTTVRGDLSKVFYTENGVLTSVIRLPPLLISQVYVPQAQIVQETSLSDQLTLAAGSKRA